MCGLNGTVNQIPIPNPTTSTRDVATWHQCSAPPVSTNINTASYGQGALPLYIAGYDAAGRTIQYTRTIYVDNSTPTLTLSGPTNASTTAGTQYVTAHAGGSPSGIDGISCSVDGGPGRWYPGASAHVPVSGTGEHGVRCNAFDNAVSAAGVRAASPTRAWSMKIGEPTELGVAFVKYVGLKCSTIRKRRTIPGHWVTRRRHGRTVKVKTRPRHTTVKVTECHPRTKHERVVVRVPLRHHGRIVRHDGKVVYRRKVEHKRIVIQPHWKAKTTRRVRFGHATTVSGWLGLANGTALQNHTVQVLTAPDNGLERFTVAATATTAANGTWTVRLPRGPSRLVRAVYAGGPDTEGTGSGEVKEIVRSKVKLQSVVPTHVAWGHSISIKGKLFGGHLPAGGVNVRMRIGIGHAKATYGVHEHVKGRGRFSTTYTFGAGPARIHRRYWFQIATLPSGNYPYSPSSSNRIYVDVGGHPRGGRPHHADR
jgi:hypothetical protein